MIQKIFKSFLTMNSNCHEIQWYPWKILQQNVIKPSNYAILILNTPIYWKPDFLFELWKNAAIKVLVDGGTYRWHKWVNQSDLISTMESFQPDLVTGDMDSIDQELLEKIKKNHSVKVVPTPDQDETDFTKALREIHTFATDKNMKIENVISVVDSWGRIDHTMGNIETLFHSKKILGDIPVFLLGSDSVSWLIHPGKHRIDIPEQIYGCWCSLVPIGKKCERILTKGLKWNLDNQSLSFGELVSTSNTYEGLGYVTIDTSDRILWSMGLCGIPTQHKEFL